MSKKKILVTGGCGYIGSHTVVGLIESGFDVVVVDDLSNSNKFIIDNIKEITGIKPEFIQADLKNADSVENIFRYNRDVFATIHFAAHKAVGESVKKPLKYYKNNLFSLLNVLSAQKKNEINNFIFSSSATVYGAPKTLPITENNETQRPFSSYGNTKKIAEEILEDYIKSNPDFLTISLRYFNPIGAHKSGLIGELPQGIPNNLLPYITQTAVGQREKLLVYGDDYPTPDGTPIRDYIHVVDLAEAHVKAVNRLLKNESKQRFEIFNLGTGKGYSVMEIIKAFEKVSQKKLNYQIAGRRDGDVPVLYASTELAEQKLKWKAKLGLEEMISSSWEWEQNFRKEKN